MAPGMCFLSPLTPTFIAGHSEAKRKQPRPLPLSHRRLLGSGVTVHGAPVILIAAKNLSWNHGPDEILRYAQNDDVFPAREQLRLRLFSELLTF